jgi:hypothetical protein
MERLRLPSTLARRACGRYFTYTHPGAAPSRSGRGSFERALRDASAAHHWPQRYLRHR